MNNMNAFQGTDDASLAFKEELLQLAPGYYLGDLHRHTYMTAKDLIGEAGNAYQEGLTGEEYMAEVVESARCRKPSMKSFLDHGLTKDMIHGTRSSFESSCRNWVSSVRMSHPAFGYFKLCYSPSGHVDYKSCFQSDHASRNVSISDISSYPAPSFSWLHALPEVLVADDSDTETLSGTDDNVINDEDVVQDDDSNEIVEVVEATDDVHQLYFVALRSPAETKPFASLVYKPPHKRDSHDTSHFRSQSDLAVLSTSASSQGGASQRNQSEGDSQWQRIVDEGRSPFTGGAYGPHHSHVPASLPAGPVRSMTERTYSRSLSTQSAYKVTRQYSKSIRDLADNLNCSLFVRNLPEDVQYKEIFAVITTGSVVSVHIHEPLPGLPCSAAKINFKYPEGAARFMALVNSSVGIQIRDHHLAAVYNKYGMIKHACEHQSRVINIHGPYKLMTEGFWRTYFGKVAKYNLDRIVYLPFDPKNKVIRSMEFHFCRIEPQAQSILLAIAHDFRFGGKISCKYGIDPCGRDWEALSPE